MRSGRQLTIPVLLIVFLSASRLYGEPAYRLYTTEDGLPSTFVKHVTQIEPGYMAIATDDGVAFFDGYDFHTRCISNGLPGHFVKQILVDDRGRILVATDKGPGYSESFSGQIPDRFHTLPFAPPDNDYRIRALHQTGDGRILMAGQNIVYELDRNDKVREIPFAFQPVRQNNLVRSFSFEDDAQGGVLITSVANNLLYLQPDDGRIVRVRGTGLPASLRDIMPAGENRYWVGSDDGLFLIDWDPEGASVTGRRRVPGTRGITMDNLATGPDGSIYAGTDGSGLYRIHPETLTVEHRRTFFSDYIKDVFFDEKGNRWISTDHGIVFIPQVPFGNIGSEDGLPRRYVTGVVRDETGSLWIATHEGIFFRETHLAPLRKLDYLDQELIPSIHYQKETGRIYVFATNAIHAIDVQTQRGQRIRDFETSVDIMGSVVDGRHIWMVSNTGTVMMYDRRRDDLRTLEEADGITHPVSGITRTRDGLLWVSGASGFLAWYHAGSQRFVQVERDVLSATGNTDALFSYIQGGTNNYLWIGGINGLYTFDPFAPNPSLNKVMDLDDGNIRWIRKDGEIIWAGTNRYLHYLKVDGDDRIALHRRFSTKSGLISTNFGHGAAYLDDEGYLWMGTNVGVTYYNNGPVRTEASPVRLRYWRAENMRFTTTEEQKLDSDVNNLTFAFTTLDFPPEDIVFQSRMHGGYSEWSESTSSPVFSQFIRGSGRYEFQVRASRNSTDWTEPFAVSFVIARPWWQGNLMIGVYLLLLAVVVYGLMQWKSYRLRVRNKELADGVREHTQHLKKVVQTLEDEIEQREEVEKELRETNYTNERMIKIVSHDLRSPFQGILGFASMLQEEYEEFSDEERREMVGQIINSSNLAVSLLNQLLDWISLQTGRMPFSPSYHNLSENVQEVTELLKSLADSKDIRLVTGVPDNLTVYADRTMLQSMLRNLLSNAIKFTGRDGKITIEAAATNSHAEISVSDNGVGMDQETLEKILAKEKAVTTKGTGKESGSGLGLIMTKEMINRHGGELTGKSKVNRGTTFTFTLPRKNDGLRTEVKSDERD
ncbi:MAG: ATP-binding protein [Cyclonatronaceae bacterium]